MGVFTNGRNVKNRRSTPGMFTTEYLEELPETAPAGTIAFIYGEGRIYQYRNGWRLTGLDGIDWRAKMLVTLKNYQGDTDLAYPLGVFSTTGTYLGIANNEAEYITLWNADVNNQAVGQISSGTGTEFVFLPVYINSLVNLYALEYYSIQAPANVVLHLDDGDTVVYGSTVKKAVDSPLVDSDTKREWNPDVFAAGVQYHVPQFFCREVTCTGYTNNAVMRIFHSRTSKVFASRTAFGHYLISGVLPTSLKYFYVCGQQTTNYNSVTNWASLSALEWFLTDHRGGGVWNLVDANLPADMNITSIKGFQFGQYNAAGANTLAILSRVTSTIKQLQFSQNSTSAKFMAAALINAIPKFSELLILPNRTDTPVTSAEIDYALNTLATKLAGIVPTGEAAIIINNSNVRTSASDAAYTALTGAGWTITLV